MPRDPVAAAHALLSLARLVYRARPRASLAGIGQELAAVVKPLEPGSTMPAEAIERVSQLGSKLWCEIGDRDTVGGMIGAAMRGADPAASLLTVARGVYASRAEGARFGVIDGWARVAEVVPVGQELAALARSRAPASEVKAAAWRLRRILGPADGIVGMISCHLDVVRGREIRYPLPPDRIGQPWENLHGEVVIHDLVLPKRRVRKR